MKCDKCGAYGPLEIDVGDGSGTYPWPFGWCPFCAEREFWKRNHDEDGDWIAYVQDIGCFRE